MHTHTLSILDLKICSPAFMHSLSLAHKGLKIELSERWRADHIQFNHYKEDKERPRELKES